MIDRMTHNERISRYLDQIGKLAARHGIWIESGARGTLLHVREDLADGYHAWSQKTG